MLFFRALRLMVHLFRGMAICAFIFPLIDAAGREGHVRRWSRQLLGICGIQVVVRQGSGVTEPLPPRALIVANHVSWLDIFVVNAMQPCRFVAKSDIRSWPFIGWLCAKTGTIFISRGKASDVRRIFQGLVTSIKAGERVAFFPEGTTAAQGKLLPFHANLFEAAIDAAVPVQPYALRYLDAEGKYHTAADFIGDMTIVGSIAAILSARAMTAELTQLPSIPTTGAHRRELAVIARKVIAEGLGYVPEDLIQSAAPAGTTPAAIPGPQAAPQ
ncbi:1-acyl-sn-glycerol-3-phosphate acyltransferase [Herbaspirillum sp. Sphag1AN]|uniref:lysophospholipid acyltransferase family protein n=1 Tax=unclassified Herbaspirillum TaxID=2624150 RepID=UPI00161460D1|nr:MULTISPECIES: lysophospholipid acyltransferase family protein [unclassified Herbaspirillum]MBB3213021.1 1-acyl-sn-glycerol-3-phosphate acyltransferase [Herbaspirillum sp. Sphag1AN]MBB3246218.1 1-acyl-sn-glycerol-3-phosphate acyltransferase [Herbaspirillum sp. Sphag64]